MRLSCAYMAEHFAHAFGLELAALRRRDRRRNIVEVKREVIRLLRDEGYTLNQIAGALGYADHTTVLHHLKTVVLCTVCKKAHRLSVACWERP